MSQKAYNLLGLAQRAGQVQSGDSGSEALLKKGKVRLIILAGDASDKTKEHFINIAKLGNVPWIEAGEKLQLGIALGKSPRSVVVVTDDGFALRLQELFCEA